MGYKVLDLPGALRLSAAYAGITSTHKVLVEPYLNIRLYTIECMHVRVYTQRRHAFRSEWLYMIYIIYMHSGPGFREGFCWHDCREQGNRYTPRYRLVCICFPTPGRGLPYGSGLRLSRCLGPGECLHSFIHCREQDRLVRHEWGVLDTASAALSQIVSHIVPRDAVHS